MITRSVQGKLLVLAICIVGIATGVLSANLYRTRVVESSAKPAETRQQQGRLSPQERAKRDQERMFGYLGVDPSQQEQIKKILDETRGQFRELREKVDPQFKSI